MNFSKISKSFVYLSIFLFLLFFFCRISFSAVEDGVRNNEKGVAALQAKDYRRAIEYFRKALRELPDNKVVKKNLSNAYHDYGAVFFSRGETLNAVDYFEKSIRYDAKNVYSLIDLGRAYYKQNKLDRAVDYLSQAYQINPEVKGLKDLLLKAKQETAVESDLQKMQSLHFIIVSAADININNYGNIRISLEQAYSRMGAFFDYFPKTKTGVILYSDAAYQKLNQTTPYWAHAHFDGKIRIPLAQKIYSKDYLRKMIYHEFTHALIRQLTHGNCPIWLNEGLASYAEGLVEHRPKSFFTQYITKTSFIPFDKLPSGYSQIEDSRQANLVYREYYLLASFIIDKQGNSALRKILNSLGSGQSISDAITQATSMNMDQFAAAWHGYVKRKLGF